MSTPEPDLSRVGPLDVLADTARGYLFTWNQAVQAQAARVLDDSASRVTQQADAYLLVIALRQLIRAAILLKEESVGEEHDVAAQAIEAFYTTVPDFQTARDVLEHFDDYARGVGDRSQPNVHRRKRIPNGDLARQFSLSYEIGAENAYVLRLGAITIDIGHAAIAADELTGAILEQVYGSADAIEAIRAFGEPSRENPAATALLFFAALGDATNGPDLAILNDLVTPESLSQWDFESLSDQLVDYGIASNPIERTEQVVSMKLLPIHVEAVKVRGDVFLQDALLIDVHQRPDLDGRWYVHQIITAVNADAMQDGHR